MQCFNLLSESDAGGPKRRNVENFTTYTASSGNLLIRFTSNNYFTHPGFTATWSTANASATVTCSGDCECTPSTGTTSGNISDGPSDYANNADCSWLISSSSEIHLAFTSFHLDTSNDAVQINECLSPACASARELARLSGRGCPSGQREECQDGSCFCLGCSQGQELKYQYFAQCIDQQTQEEAGNAPSFSEVPTVPANVSECLDGPTSSWSACQCNTGASSSLCAFPEWNPLVSIVSLKLTCDPLGLCAGYSKRSGMSATYPHISGGYACYRCLPDHSFDSNTNMCYRCPSGTQRRCEGSMCGCYGCGPGQDLRVQYQTLCTETVGTLADRVVPVTQPALVQALCPNGASDQCTCEGASQVMAP